MADPEEVYFSMLRAMTASNREKSWAVQAKILLLRKRLGISDAQHAGYVAQLEADLAVQALKRGELPSAKRQKTGSQPAAAAAVEASSSLPAATSYSGQRPGAKASGDKPKARGRGSETGAPPGVQLGIEGRMTRFDKSNPMSLIGHRLTITQEDDSQVEVTVMEYDPASRQHSVVTDYGTPDQSELTPVPLWDNPQSYAVIGEQPGYPFPAPSRPAAAGSGVAATRGSMLPPPAPAGAGFHAPRAAGPKQPKRVQAGGGGRGHGSGGTRQHVPFEAGHLAQRLGQAGLVELSQMLAAISKREKAILHELEVGGHGDPELAESINKRAELVQQLAAAR